MNPIRPLLRTALRTRFATPSVASLSRRTLVTPTSPAQAKVSEVSLDQRIVEDPGEFDEGDHIAGEGEGGEGESPMTTFGLSRSDESEMFGFKLNPVATKTGGQAKSAGRPIYLDMQVGEVGVSE